MLKKNWPLYLIVIGTLIGLLFTYLLMREHHFGPIIKQAREAVGMIDGFNSGVCGDEKSYFNCAAVNQSAYSKVAGVPLTTWGMFYFIFSLCMAAALIFLTTGYHRSHAVLYYWYIAFGSAYAVVLFFISIIAIRKICPLCMITYGSHWVSLAMISIYCIREGISPLKIKEALRGMIGNADKASAYKYFIALLVSLVFSGVIGFGSEPLVVIMKDEYLREQNEQLARQSMEKFGQERAVVINISSRPVMGDLKALVTIAEFSDFFCPHCAVTAEILREVLVDNPGKVRVVFFNFPLDIDCNPVMTRQLHQGACIIARGASCAARQGKFEQYYNFSFQLKMERATLNTAMQIAQYAGADMTRFQSCMMSPESQNDLRKDLTAANSLGISSTPRLFVNGKSVSGPFTRELLNQIIMKELAASR